MESYNHNSIETKWQDRWEEIGLFKADRDPSKKKYYCLTMYPYPSGTLHMGHVINYTLGDSLVRYHLMKGENVLTPMGWDSFGLPAENAAIREGVAPRDFTAQNIDKMRSQMKKAGWGYDWDREIATSHPGYYRWTQWIFSRLLEKGLAFKKDASVNWCSSCATVLANEQVIQDRCERCNTEVEQKQLNQWFFKMSAYAERLLENHSILKGKWPDNVLKMQEEWIGRSEGVEADFILKESGEKISIFTTRPDTIYGVTFMAVSPHHPLLEKLLKGTPQQDEVMAKVRELRKQNVSIRNIEEVEKVGVDTGIEIVNPLNGNPVQLWVANFVLMEYGTGIIMAVPAHDQRDFEFAREYTIPIKVVINPEGEALDPDTMEAAFTEEGIMTDSGEFDGMKSGKALEAIADHLEKEGIGKRVVNYRLKDWLLSRQRYWGAPIPVVYCDDCGMVAVPDSDLPVLLPENVKFTSGGESPLAKCGEFVNTACPSCGKPARRETDTMDTFVDSSWYFLRYLNPRDEEAAFRGEDINYWMPVDQYIGGIEHATMHLVYFRFLMLALNDLGIIDFEEPVDKLFCQGMVCKIAHYCEKDKWLRESDVDLENGTCRKCGGPVKSDMAKISKTKLNTVSPDEIIDEFGADTMRLNILSDNPPYQEQIWSDESVKGAFKFLKRFYATIRESIESAVSPEASQSSGDLDGADKEVFRKLHQTILRFTRSIEENMHFNTAIAAVFELMNAYRSRMSELSPFVKKEVTENVLRLLSPITPHICEELWEQLGKTESIFKSPWPEADSEAAAEDVIEIVLQINGKVRSKLTVPAGTGEDELEKAALEDEKIQAAIEGKQVRKVIVIPSRLVNIVAS